MSSPSPKALVVLRVPRGAAPPGERDLQEALAADRVRLVLPRVDTSAFRLAGPYAIELDGQALDEYVAWEV